MKTTLRDLLFGTALAEEDEGAQRIGSIAGVGVLGLDALASAAYGPEALLTVLLPLGAAGLAYLPPLTAILVALLSIVALSYRQTIDAYPGGGGAYTVAKENLGATASLFAAASLALDYLLNVAVAISAGVGALTSALPGMWPHSLLLCLAILAILVLVNLRGVRITGAAFMLPTYAFVLSLGAVLAIGLSKAILHGGHPTPVVAPTAVAGAPVASSLWLLVRAFSSGCTAMTGVEAVSNGVPLFREPATRRARTTLMLIIGILIALLAGIAALCCFYGVSATPPGRSSYQSVLSQLTVAVVGRGAFYGVTIASIVTVLALSANTSFADFPRVCRMLAADQFLPEAFLHRGRRLTFSHGVLVLGVLSGLLLVAFGGITDPLIPLFAIGALFAFTMSQAGMVAHWRKRSGGQARRGVALNGVGAVATGATLLVALVSKFREGAWISLVLVSAMLFLFRGVRRHYEWVDRVTAADASLVFGPPRPPLAVVPLRRWDAVALKALTFAAGFSVDVVAVQVLTGDGEADDLTSRWEHLVAAPARAAGLRPPALVVKRSRYRQLCGPLVEFIVELTAHHPDKQVAVILPELVEPHWYHYLLHSHTASVLKAWLLFRGGPQIVVVSAPWYLRDWAPERRRLRRPSRAGPSRLSQS